jgi:hypothetical protein
LKKCGRKPLPKPKPDTLAGPIPALNHKPKNEK